jgi:desulfoferrodoxin (superoxide reductase-like protein)
VALWDGLTAALGADMIKLLQGELHPNPPDMGNIKRVRFYVCPVCGNILVSTGDASIACCGRKLKPLPAVPSSVGHEVSVEESDLEYYITLRHDMRKAHYIAFIAYVHDDQVLLVRLYPEQSAAVRLPMAKRGGALYLYCTRHGLQRCPFLL